MRVTVLGCGGSMGVPMVGGNWGHCDPAEPRNRRRRPSILVEAGETVVLVDTTPDLRSQLLDAGVQRVDAVLYTHDHADHIHGIDDLRPFTYRSGRPIPIHGDPATMASLEQRFSYAIASMNVDRGLYKAIAVPHRIEGPFRIGDLSVVPFVQDHGNARSLGFRFGAFGYSTDVVNLDEAAFAALEGIEVWIVDATREDPHPSHAHLERTLGWIARLRPRQAYLTHMNHTMDYNRLCRILPPGVAPAHDGLVIEI
jgi:phosphoribosyl 1,2-cyclic phosphate phosphodiesterase